MRTAHLVIRVSNMLIIIALIPWLTVLAPVPYLSLALVITLTLKVDFCLLFHLPCGILVKARHLV